MNILELIALTEARLARLDQIRSSAVQVGDALQLISIDRDILETTETLRKLQSQL